MLESSQEACQFLGDNSFESFCNNRLLLNAVIRSLEIVGEAAVQISQEFKEKHSQIEWRIIIAMRNRLIHAYFDVNEMVVFKTVKDDLPVLIEQLESIL